MLTRFAPSPTGLLHLGHAYAAKFAYELARQHNGRFLLRFEDIDTTRVRQEYYKGIEEDLAWLGICWHGQPVRQVDRLEVYQKVLEDLKSLNVIYPCFCTRREIQQEVRGMVHAPHGPEGFLYPQTCRKLSQSERDERMLSGESHCWRLDVSTVSNLVGPLDFNDEFRGLVQVDPSLLGDVVLARKDIATSYHLSVVVDDAMQEISDVTRGEDLLGSTHVHRLLQKLLALPVPLYHHHRLILDDAGKRLAKRDDSLSIRTLREQGVSPNEVWLQLNV